MIEQNSLKPISDLIVFGEYKLDPQSVSWRCKWPWWECTCTLGTGTLAFHEHIPQGFHQQIPQRFVVHLFTSWVIGTVLTPGNTGLCPWNVQQTNRRYSVWPLAHSRQSVVEGRTHCHQDTMKSTDVPLVKMFQFWFLTCLGLMVWWSVLITEKKLLRE